MIDNYQKSVAGDMSFSLHGINYIIAGTEVDIFTQQKVISYVVDAKGGEDFDWMSGKGIEAQKKVFTHLIAEDEDGSRISLSEDMQKRFYSSKFVKDTVKKNAQDFGINNPVINHLTMLASIVQHMIINDGWELEKKSQTATESTPQSSESSTQKQTNDLSKVLKQERPKL